jgi:hypothetical protein
MGNRVMGLSLLAGVVMLAPAFGADDKSTGSKNDKNAHVDASTLPSGSYTGKMLTVPDDDGKFTAAVDFTHTSPKDPKHPEAYAQAMQAVEREQEKVAKLEADLANAKNAKEQARRAAQVEKATADLQRLTQKAAADIKTVTEQKTVDFQLNRDVKVRVMTLPSVFDGDGKIKTYTDDEKTALKGTDKQLPGYEAKLTNVKVGDAVRLVLVRATQTKTTDTISTNAAKTSDSKSTESGSGSSDTARDKTSDKGKSGADKKSFVTEIVILNDDKSDKDKSSPSKKP